MSKKQSLLLVLFVTLIALSWQLGVRGLAEPDEGRTVSIAGEMCRSGDWITPRMYDATHFDKPPLIYWFIATAIKIGGSHEWMARLPAALSGLGVILLTWAMAFRLFGSREALFASFILLTSPLFFAMAHLIDPNMLLTFFTTLAMWAALAWLQEGHPVHRWIFYLAIGLSCLVKGPVGFAIVALSLLGYRLFRVKTLPRRSIWHGPGAVLCMVLGLSWFVVVAVKYPELWDFFLGRELYGRVFTEVHRRHEPFLYYFFILPVGMLPWLPTLLPALRDSWRTFRTDSPTCFLGSWILFPLIMFTFSGSKMPTYVLPLLPAFALLMGHRISTSLDRPHRATVQTLLIITLSFLMPVALAIYGRQRYGWTEPWVPMDFAWLALGLATLMGLLKARQDYRPLYGSAMLLVSFLALHDMFSRHDNEMGPHSTTRNIAHAINEVIRPEDRIALLGRHPRGLSFYVEHPFCIPTYKFNLQIQSDEDRLAGRLFKEAAEAYVWFDSTQRVFFVTSDEEMALAKDHIHRPIHEIYRDSKYLLVSNQ